MDGLMCLVAGMALLSILAVLAIEFGADSRDGYVGSRARPPRS